MEITIKVDSREQQPYKFAGPWEIGKLDVGDYSITGLEDYIAIERKTLDDVIGCLTAGRGRFEKELYRARVLDYFALVIEATLEDLASHKYRSNMNPKSAVQSLLAFSIRYRLPVFFVGNRQYGARVTESLLQKYAREIEKRFKQITNSKEGE